MQPERASSEVGAGAWPVSSVARDVAFVALEWGLHGQACRLFSRVARQRPHEPQSLHGMALTAADMGRPELAIALFELGLCVAPWGAPASRATVATV